MTTLVKFRLRLAVLAIVFTLAAQAQAPPPGQPATPVANQVPLSGRSGETGSVNTGQSPVAGTTNSVNTINPTIQVQGPYTGSVPGGGAVPDKLTLQEAVKRGLDFNLGTRGLTYAIRQAQGQSAVVRSSLMPNVTGSLAETVQQTNLRAQGIRISAPFPGFAFPGIVGPFNYFDLRARLTQSIADLTALNNYRSANESLHAAEFQSKDARDLVVLATGGAYLQVAAAKARVISARSQLEAAEALFKQTAEQRAVGLVAQIDVNKSEVQSLTQRQRLVTLENDLSKQKINLARIIGLPPNDKFDIANDIPYAESPSTTEDDAVAEALTKRPDIQAAEAQIRAAERARDAARAERMPSLSMNADYGAIGTNPAQSHGTFSVTGTLRIPIWQGGRAEGDIEQASAALDQRRAELADAKSRAESDVRSAYLDIGSAASQVELARRNLDVTRQTLELTRQRFEAGVTDAVDVSQQQAAVASSELDYINGVFAHNVAKLGLARAAGDAADNLGRFLKLQ
jgi:outer membrane protein TolC